MVDGRPKTSEDGSRMVAVRSNGEVGVLSLVKVEPRFVRWLGRNIKEKKS